jgi:hypothetical protein
MSDSDIRDLATLGAGCRSAHPGYSARRHPEEPRSGVSKDGVQHRACAARKSGHLKDDGKDVVTQ